MMNQIGFIKAKNNVYINTAAIQSIGGNYEPKISTNEGNYAVGCGYSAEQIAASVIEAQKEGKIIDLSV